MTNSQPVVTPNALNFTPDNKHAYAYSGEFTSSTVANTVIEFNTNSEYIKGKVRLAGMVDMGSPATGNQVCCRVSFNDVVVLDLLTEGADKDMTFSDHADIIIPPFTNVKCIVDMNTTSTGTDGTVSIIGKAYGMTDTGFQ